MLKYALVLLGTMSLVVNGAWAAVMIENADDVNATWTLSGNAYSATAISGGVSGNALRLVANPSSGQAVFTTTSLSGDMSAYMNGSIEFDYRTLGVSGYADGPWGYKAGYPRYIAVRISGGADPANQWIEFNVTTWSNGGLAWDVNYDWHTIKLAFADGLGVRAGSEFDSVAATTATLSTVANSNTILNDPAKLADMWSNVTSIYIGNTHYIGDGPYAATAIDNLQLVPEPGTMALLGLGSLLMARRRK